LIGALIIGGVNAASTAGALLIVDGVGRRKLLLTGTTGILLSLVAIGFIFLVGEKPLSLLLFAFILLYIVSFAIGLGPVYWLMSSEVFPTRLRGAGASISTVGNWGSNLVVTVTYLTMIVTIGKSWTFWVYAICAFITLLFIWSLIPETRDKRLEQIEEYWQRGRE
jgi:MFS family permease